MFLYCCLCLQRYSSFDRAILYLPIAIWHCLDNVNWNRCIKYAHLKKEVSQTTENLNFKTTKKRICELLHTIGTTQQTNKKKTHTQKYGKVGNQQTNKRRKPTHDK